MALVKDPIAKANKATTRLQAARLKEELEVELALNDNTPAGWDDQADQALDVLRGRFGELTDDDWTHSSAKWSPSLSHSAKKGLVDRTTDPEERKALNTDHAKGEKGDHAARSRVYRRARPHMARRAGRRAWRDTGIPRAASSSSRTALSYVGLAIGLSLLYLLLSNAEKSKRGRSAVELAAGGFATAITHLVSPNVDLLPGPTPAAAPPAPNTPGSPFNWQRFINTPPRRPGARTPSTPPRRRGAPPAISQTNLTRSP